MTKRETLDDPKSCLNKAADDEPVFVLRAKDPLASKVVRYWALLAEAGSDHELEKATAANHVAMEMDVWREKQTSHTS